MNKRIIFAATGVLTLVVGAAQASVNGITIADASSGNYTLTSVTVTRGASGIHTYLPNQLTNIDLTDVGATGSVLATQSGAGLPAVGNRAELLEDNRMDTGVINPVSTAADADFSFEVTFLHPVVNSDGEDILVFELGGNDTTRFWINNDRANQSLDIAPANFSSDLLTGMPFDLYSYNNAGDIDINTMAELESPTGFTFNSSSTSSVNAAGIDLSSFGIPLGGTLSSLRFQAVTGRIDPVMIVGLPAVPEPASLALLIPGLLGLRQHRAR